MREQKSFVDNEGCEHYLDTKYIVCPYCDGEGSYVNPGIEHDGGGFTASEWQEACYEDPDFADDYFGGVYNIPCEKCHGKRVVLDVDEDAIDPELLDKYHQYLREESYFAAERESERRFGA